MASNHSKSLILQSFESDRMDLEAFIPVFYRMLFATHPDLRALFPNDTARLEEKMLAALTHIAEAVEDTGRLNAILNKLGETHRKMQVSDAHVDGFIKSFTGALAHTLGPEWNDEMQQAWSDFLVYVAMKMNFLSSQRHKETQP